MDGDWGVFFLAFILAMFVQLIVGRFKTLISDKYTALVALVISIILCVVYKAGILNMIGLTAQFRYGEYVDYVLTGIAISGGASGLTEFTKSILGQIVRTRDNR